MSNTDALVKLCEIIDRHSGLEYGRRACPTVFLFAVKFETFVRDDGECARGGRIGNKFGPFIDVFVESHRAGTENFAIGYPVCS